MGHVPQLNSFLFRSLVQGDQVRRPGRKQYVLVVRGSGDRHASPSWAVYILSVSTSADMRQTASVSEQVMKM